MIQKATSVNTRQKSIGSHLCQEWLCLLVCSSFFPFFLFIFRRVICASGWPLTCCDALNFWFFFCLHWCSSERAGKHHHVSFIGFLPGSNTGLGHRRQVLYLFSIISPHCKLNFEKKIHRSTGTASTTTFLKRQFKFTTGQFKITWLNGRVKICHFLILHSQTRWQPWRWLAQASRRALGHSYLLWLPEHLELLSSRKKLWISPLAFVLCEDQAWGRDKEDISHTAHFHRGGTDRVVCTERRKIDYCLLDTHGT